MTTILRDDIMHLATLCAIKLADAEINSMRVDIERIIGYIDLLDELDTTDIEPTFQVSGLSNAWRSDKVEPSIESSRLIALAHDSENTSIKVPKVL